MIPLYIFALLVHTAFSNMPCKVGVEIISKETHNPEDLIGNWSYVYSYKPKNSDPDVVVKKLPWVDYSVEEIAPVSPDLLKAKEVQCATNKKPLDWSDAKLTLFSNIIFMGEKENWVMYSCEINHRMVAKIVPGGGYLAIIYPEMDVVQLFSRKAPTSEKLNCVLHNLDVGKSMAIPKLYTDY